MDASAQSPIKIGQLVIISEDNLPPGQWPLGRGMEVHPGADQLIRVRLKGCLVKRSVNKLCVLPIDDYS